MNEQQAAALGQRIAIHHAAGHFGGIDQHFGADLAAVGQSDEACLEIFDSAAFAFGTAPDAEEEGKQQEREKNACVKMVASLDAPVRGPLKWP